MSQSLNFLYIYILTYKKSSYNVTKPKLNRKFFKVFFCHPGCSAFGVHHPTWPLSGGGTLDAHSQCPFFTRSGCQQVSIDLFTSKMHDSYNYVRKTVHSFRFLKKSFKLGEIPPSAEARTAEMYLQTPYNAFLTYLFFPNIQILARPTPYLSASWTAETSISSVRHLTEMKGVGADLFVYFCADPVYQVREKN